MGEDGADGHTGAVPASPGAGDGLADRRMTSPTAVLSLIRRFAAPRDAVFHAWTDPDALRAWWIPDQGCSVPHVEIDLRVGGSYRITMRRPDGSEAFLVGRYREVHAPERLVYTWRWDGPTADEGETLVTVEFRDLGGSTEVAIRHEGFASARARELHDRGWSACLARLPRVLA
jgi:uncharacterized protein YndB with AHSA1/START domain